MKYKKTILSIIIISSIATIAYFIYAYNNTDNIQINTVENEKLQNKINNKFSKISLDDIIKQKQELKNTLQLPYKNDNKLLKFIADDNISRIDKINAVMKEIEKAGISSEQAQLFMDILSALKPIEYAQKIASWLKADMPEVNKIHLLTLLKNMYSIGFDANLPQSNINGLIENKKYIVDQIKQYIYDASFSTTSRQFALTQYGYMASPEDIGTAIKDILTNKINFKDKSTRVGDLEFFIATSMLQDDSINTLMPSVLQTLNANKNNPNLAINKDNFIGKLSAYLQDDNNGKPLMDILSPELRKITYEFLKENSIDATHFSEDTDTFYYGEYNKAIFKFKYGSDNWLKPFMNNYLQETNPNKLAGLSFALSEDKISKELSKYDTSSAKFILANEKKLLESKGAEIAEKNTSLYWDYYAVTTALIVLNN